MVQRAAFKGIDWSAAEELGDRNLAARLNQSGGGKIAYKMPDYEYIHREMQRPGGTLQLPRRRVQGRGKFALRANRRGLSTATNAGSPVKSRIS